MSFARITGSGSYLPERVLSNRDLEAMVDTTAQWIVERTGVRQRHIAAEDESTCDLAEVAVRRALEAAERSPGEIDLIVLGTTTPDKIFPSTACLLQERLGIKNCPAFDVQAVCSGFVYALDIAYRYIKTEGATRALVIGAETFSRIVDWSDRTTCVLFGDGAGAVVLEASDKPGILSCHLHADGQYQSLLHVPDGIYSGRRSRPDTRAYVKMQGGEVFKFAVKAMEQMADEALSANGMQKHDLDWLIPHQANSRIIEAAARKLNLPMEQVVTTVDRHGNTSAASIPLALDEAIRDGRIERGQLLLLEAVGAGFTWGSVLLRY
ncbi:MAG: beta-ketoacyl-ACP synthase III [Gammaproteobacteria bacterium]